MVWCQNALERRPIFHVLLQTREGGLIIRGREMVFEAVTENWRVVLSTSDLGFHGGYSGLVPSIETMGREKEVTVHIVSCELVTENQTVVLDATNFGFQRGHRELVPSIGRRGREKETIFHTVY